MSDIHPSVGEKKDRNDMIRFWDVYADHYSSLQQGDIPERIINRLFDLGMLQANDCTMEIGSGPGTYSLILASKVRKLVCMDTSDRMLDILFSKAEKMGYTNIERFKKDWSTYQPRKGYDSCMATLCPGTGSSESIERMEATARRSCILVSWVENHGDDLDSRIWKELGKDYGYEFRKSTQVQDWLRDNGREPTVEFFDARIETDIHIDDLIRAESCVFSFYQVDEDIGGIVRRILGPELDGDIIHYSAVNRMKMICWNSSRL